MKKIGLLFTSTFLIISFSCTDPKKDNKDIPVCKYNKHSDLLKNKPLFKLTKVVPLETIEESLISQINQIVVFNDKLIVLDKMQNKVLIFDKNGKYIRSLKTGKGPGELVMPSHIETSKNGKVLYVSDLYRKIKYYDDKLNFIKTINPQKLGFVSFYEVDNEQFLLSNETNKNEIFFYSIYDSKKDKITYELERKSQETYPNYTCIIANNFVNAGNGTTISCIPYSKYIRIIDNKTKSVKKICKLDFGIYDNKPLAHLSKGKKSVEFTTICRNKNKISYLSGFLKIAPKKYLFKFYVIDGLSYGIVDISNQNISLYPINKIYPDSLDFMFPSGNFNGQLICSAQSPKITEYKSQYKSKLKNTGELSKLIDITEYDNPVLFYYKVNR